MRLSGNYGRPSEADWTCVEKVKIPNLTVWTAILYLRTVPPSIAQPGCSQAFDSITNQPSNKIMGRRFSPAPRTTNCQQQLALVATIATVLGGYGPGHILRAAHDFVTETTFVIFGNDLDA